ncbi:efflux RND transporter periplasmic adaptor subunit [Aurantimonas sp. MSK8Z-1]|uniref:efflux RND transporter periplasmic adaptor subunit n=1 Tax=Mangrovibrevibacter kandeliae TaxID=2968473 RepID=UPI002118AA0A|nr:efflux RND transporter periplasmic adaptor subunit [Aurantimonas sp. MSK8Z-1]MCW4116325.1 efflux RND transporter periplasmic adaptor subunit [Aurantimonas sp. MSK8Z-1]
MLFALGLALAACSQEGGSGQQQAAGGKGAARPPAEVGVVTLHPKPVTITSNVAGRTSAYESAEIRPQVNGLIVKKVYADGARVATGDLLYVIDDKTYQAAVDSAQATLEKTKATLASAEASAKRYQDLLGRKAISQQEADNAQATYLSAKADVSAAEAALRSARIDLDRTEIRAPLAGIAGQSTVDPGALVTSNQATALTTIRRIDPIYVDLTETGEKLLDFRRSVQEGKLKALVGNDDTEKAKVTLTLPDGSTYGEPGTIDFADITISESTGSFTFRAVFPNPDRILLPGMYVRAKVEAAINENGFLVPQRAVSRNAKGEATALFVTAENKAQMRILGVQQDIGNDWLVNSGVSDGDRVIVDGLQKIADGATVKPTPVTIDENGLVSAAAPAKEGDAPSAGAAPAAGGAQTEAAR